MRQLINLIEKRPNLEFSVLKSLNENMEPNDWRAWITADGELHEVVGDVTHAEYSTTHFPYDRDDDNEEFEDYTDYSFTKALDAGWIRVGINLISFEFFANCQPSVTRPALTTLLRVLDSHYADNFLLDMAGTSIIYAKTVKSMKTQIAKLMQQLNEPDSTD